MIRISIAYFYDIGSSLQPLSAVKAEMSLVEVWSTLFNAQNVLESLFSTEWFWPAVRASHAPGQKLLSAIKMITDRKDFVDGKIMPFEEYALSTSLKDFETVVKADLSIADAYFVSRKAGFDTGALISNAEVNFPRELGTKVPAAIPEIREAGRALAFELSTGAGFYLFRALEAVLRRYWDAVSNGAPHPDQRNIGVYLSEMRKAQFGSQVVLAVLTQIKDLHRNPISHPDATLSLDDAVTLFGISQSAIAAMLKEIEA